MRKRLVKKMVKKYGEWVKMSTMFSSIEVTDLAYWSVGKYDHRIKMFQLKKLFPYNLSGYSYYYRVTLNQ